MVTELENNPTSLNLQNSSYYVQTFSSSIFYSSYAREILETAIRTKITEFIEGYINGVGFAVEVIVIISFAFTLLLTYLSHRIDQ